MTAVAAPVLRRLLVVFLTVIPFMARRARGGATQYSWCQRRSRAIADLTGAFVNPDPVYLQSAGFVLGPQGKVVGTVHSSGAIGRLIPEDVAGVVRYLREHDAASA